MTSENTRVQFYSGTSEAWDAMYRDCVMAQESIELEQYILMDDAAGHRFLQLFVDKAKAGVRISLILDAIGSRGLLFSSYVDEIHKAGGMVYFYSKIKWQNLFFLARWFPRNHNKTMLIDGKIGYIGSVCMSDEMRDWRDMHMRFTGDLTKEVATDLKLVRQCIISKIKPYSYSSKDREKSFQYIASRQLHGSGRIYDHILRQIEAARHKICLVTPYFQPPWRLRKALKNAARRGVSIRVMISEKSDVRIADLVSRSYYLRLMRYGIRIFHFRKTILHAKYAMIDQGWATIGSTNMDYLSLLRNHESNVMIRDTTVVRQLYQQFDTDIEDCVEVKINHYRSHAIFYRLISYLEHGLKEIIQR